MSPRVALASASTQAICLEMIRRTTSPTFDGEAVASALREHQDLWLAVQMGRVWQVLRAPNSTDRVVLASWDTLRSLSQNRLDQDTLFLVAPDRASARKLKHLGREVWGATWAWLYNSRNSLRLTGMAPPCRVLELWWGPEQAPLASAEPLS